MTLIERPSSIDTALFSEDLIDPETRYGLPAEVVYCNSCVISNQRPNSAVEFKNSKESTKKTIAFSEDQICDACTVVKRKQSETNWEEREQKLHELCDRFRSSDGSYDCVVPGSGGKDSFYAAHKLKYEFGMHPLTVTWAPHIYTDWGRHNFHAWIGAGFDNVLVTPNPLVHRLLTRLSVENLFHPFQPFMLGQKLMAPKIAKKLGIPLVFYGENEAEYGNPQEDGELAQRDTRYFSVDEGTDQIFLGGQSLHSLMNDFGFERGDLQWYLPSSTNDLSSSGIEVHYLGYYLEWHPQSAFYYAVEHGGFMPSPERTPGTYSKYNSIDDKIDDLHYYTTGVKFGIGRASYDASQEIRNGDLTRDEGVQLVKKYDHEYPKRFEEELMQYLSINEREFPIASRLFEEPLVSPEHFHRLADTFRSPHLWVSRSGVWELRHPL